MSAAGPEAGGSRKREREEHAAPEALGQVVIVSNMGDTYPEELVADTVATYFLRHPVHVTSNVCVPDCGEQSIYLANHQDETGRWYTKKMIPDTRDMRFAQADCMIIFCHGTARKEGTDTPSYLSFREAKGVCVRGRPHGSTPEATKIWSCQSYTHGDRTYSAPPGGACLSEVAYNAKLVLLLCCYSDKIIEEYSSEPDETRRPDFVAFLDKHVIHDTSVNIFLALLMNAIDGTSKEGPWNERVKRSIILVIKWVKIYGTQKDEECGTGAERFWSFLLSQRCVSMVDRTRFQVRGSIAIFTASAQDKQELLEQLQSVNLVLWKKGVGAARGHYEWISHTHGMETLRAYTTHAPEHQGSDAAPGRAELDVLLLQLKGLFSGR